MQYLTQEETESLTALIGSLSSAAEDIAYAGMRDEAGLVLVARRTIRQLATRLTAPKEETSSG